MGIFVQCIMHCLNYFKWIVVIRYYFVDKNVEEKCDSRNTGYKGGDKGLTDVLITASNDSNIDGK